MTASAIRGPIHRFLRNEGTDARGRHLGDILNFDDAQIEEVHDFIQWLFPLPEASQAVPGSPVLGSAEAAAIRADPQARSGLQSGLARMSRFYADTDGWLIARDHNHLRITRIIRSVRALLGAKAATAFHAEVFARQEAAGSPVNRQSLQYWREALQ